MKKWGCLGLAVAVVGLSVAYCVSGSPPLFPVDALVTFKVENRLDETVAITWRLEGDEREDGHYTILPRMTGQVGIVTGGTVKGAYIIARSQSGRMIEKHVKFKELKPDKTIVIE